MYGGHGVAAAQEFVELSAAVRICLATHSMEQEFITIAEAARLTRQSDVELMRFLKDRMESGGLDIESITRKEQRGNRVLYVISKAFLLRELGIEQHPQASVLKEAVQGPVKDHHSSPDALLEAKDEMISTLQGVIETKDKQMDNLSKKIDELIERDRETNFLLKGLQDRIFLLEGPQRNTEKQKK